jgi:hypothetical protein
MESPVFTLSDGRTLTVPNCIRKTVDTLQCYCLKPDNPTTWQTIHYNVIWTQDRIIWSIGCATIWYLVYHYVVKDIYYRRRMKKGIESQSEAERTWRITELTKKVDEVMQEAREMKRRVADEK